MNEKFCMTHSTRIYSYEYEKVLLSEIYFGIICLLNENAHHDSIFFEI